MKVLWSPEALADLKEIRAYIAEDDPSVARQLAERLVAAAKALQDFPRRGRLGRVAGTRELVVPGTPYIVVYRVGSNSVQVAAVAHAARQR